MILLNRPDEPGFLRSEKMMAVKAKLHDSFTRSDRQERARFDISLLKEVRPQLLEMCNQKCAYCESKFGASSFSDVENFRPKAGARGLNKEYAPNHYWWLAYEWSNLLIACQICNQKYKRDYFPLEDEAKRARVGSTGMDLVNENALLIDPTNDNPELHLVFQPDGTVGELTTKGGVTIEIIGLNREDLVQRRREAAEAFTERMKLYERTPLENTQRLYESITALLSETSSHEYTATLRAVFQEWENGHAHWWGIVKNKWFKSGSDFLEMVNISATVENISEKQKNVNEIKSIKQKLSSIKRFSIKSVEIVNFRSIDEIKITILPGIEETDRKESWLLLLGDNGIGKSSILQAITLALCGKKQLKKLNLEVSDYLKKGTNSGYVRIRSFEHDSIVELKFDEQGFHTELQEAPTFLLGYGSTRLMPKGAIQPDMYQEPYVNVSNLFDYSVSLHNPGDWLRHIDEKEFKERTAPALFDVLALRGGDRVFVQDGKVMIKQFGADTDLEENSDGYKTIIALVSDMMQTLSIDAASYHNTQGIVLIDEIGNHLHPRWRLKIVSALRKAFPKLQFIVTTHEPLCLRGLAHGEVAVLVRDKQARIRLLDSTLLPDHNLMRIEQLLTSDLFGLINVLDEETEKTYEEYYRLLSKKEEEKTPEDKNKIQEFSIQLAAKESLGSTPQEQMIYQVINETYAKKIRDEGFKTTEVLKKETVEEVKTFIKKRNIDWL